MWAVFQKSKKVCAILWGAFIIFHPEGIGKG